MFISEQLKNIIFKKKYIWFNDKPNIIGVRMLDKINTFDDWGAVVYKDLFFTFKMTTDAGMYYLQNPLNSKGTAILIPGQYIDVWKIGIHKNYEALVQIGNFKVWRDNNKDKCYDFINEQDAGIESGINFHRTLEKRVDGMENMPVDKFSAGCQVVLYPEDFDNCMQIFKEYDPRKNKLLSYILLESKDIYEI